MSGLSIHRNLLMTERVWVVSMLVYIEIASMVNKVAVVETLLMERISWTSLKELERVNGRC